MRSRQKRKTGNVNNRSKLPHAEIVRMYLDGCSPKEIGKVAGITGTGVRRILIYNNVPIRSHTDGNIKRRKYNYAQIVLDYQSGLSLTVVARMHNTGASHILAILKRSGINRRTPVWLKGPSHPLWKGGVTRDRDGYAVGKFGRLHRIRSGELIGRLLKSWESAHHINGHKEDLSDENLVVMPEREHQRFHAFLRHRGLQTNMKTLLDFCRKESPFYFRFTVEDQEKARALSPMVSRSCMSRPPKMRGRCSARGCNNVSYWHNLCSKHYQRKRARERGYWLSGGGRKAKCYV